jgi:hypothetical protein
MPLKWQIMVVDKEWCHHFKHQGKPAGMQDTACHPTKATKLPASTRDKLTVVFDTERPLILGLKSCNDTSNVNCYCQTLQKLHIKIKNKHLHDFNDGIILLHNNTHSQVAHTLQDQLMPADGMCSNILHIVQTYHPETFTFLAIKASSQRLYIQVKWWCVAGCGTVI